MVHKFFYISFILTLSFQVAQAQQGGYGRKKANQKFSQKDKKKSGKNNYNYLRLANHPASSGVPLGGIGAGNVEFAPNGRFVRIGLNNIHQPVKKSKAAFFSLWYHNNEGSGAVRLVKDKNSQYGMNGVDTTYYRGLFPQVNMKFDSHSTPGVSPQIHAYSSLVPQDVKNSSLPVVYFDVKLKASSEGDYAVALSLQDFIGAGLKDPKSLEGLSGQIDMSVANGESWPGLNVGQTYVENYKIDGMQGVRQFLNHPVKHKRATHQNYNNQIVLLANDAKDVHISTNLSYSINNANRTWSEFKHNGRFSSGKNTRVILSTPDNKAASIVSAKTHLRAGESKTLHFMMVWYSPEQEINRKTAPKNSYWPGGGDYNKYYHNFFDNIDEIVKYGHTHRNQNLTKTKQWQQPILNSTLPNWYKFKLINSAYVIYTNMILNKRGDVAVNEGAMGGLSGTMDQRISAHPFYQKFFTQLDRSEMEIFADGAQADGRITHFIGNYYYGIGTVGGKNPTKNSWMIDNTGGWIIQLAKDYEQTGDKKYLKTWAPRVYQGMDFLKTLMPKQVDIPVGPTTYDDHDHPPIYSYGASIYLATLKAAYAVAHDMSKIDLEDVHKETINGAFTPSLYKNKPLKKEINVDKKHEFEKQFKESRSDFIDYLWNGHFFAYGADKDGSNRLDNILFTGQLAGQFVSRYCGWGDVVPMRIVKASIISQFKLSLSKSPDYFTDKVYDIKENKGLDGKGSQSWPFYLEDYTGYAAYQAGFYEDTFELLKHIQLVNLRKGYTWSQNLWNPGQVTYMTAPVTWFSTDVLAGAGINVPDGELRLAPMIKNNQQKVVYPLYYPHFWAKVVIKPQQKQLFFKVTKTFPDAKMKVSKIISEHQGTSTKKKKVINIPVFKVKEGKVLNLSEYYDRIVTVAKGRSILKYPDKFNLKHVAPSQKKL